MFKRLLSLAMVLMAFSAYAQLTILDFETAATSTRFQYFGSSLDPTRNQVIANPDKSGINTSDSVARFVKPVGAQTWAGGFSNPNPTRPVNLVNGTEVCIKVWMPAAGNLALKLEGSSTSPDWLQTKSIGTANQWVEVCYNTSLPSEDGAMQPAAGNIYSRIVLFFDFGTPGGAMDAVYYFDDVVVKPAATVCNNILDFETAAKSTRFQYFGSSLDPTRNQVIANPDKSGINTSDSVARFIKPVGAQTWAGGFSNPNPTTPVNLTSGTEVCIKVWMPAAGNLALKLEGSTTSPDWLQTKSIGTANQWVEVCYNTSLPSEDGAMQPAAGNIYSRIVLFFDFGTPGGAMDATYYFDDICVRASGPPSTFNVDFAVNMSQYTGTFTRVYVSGEFNGWSGTANPLSDPDADGIWTGTLNLSAGAYDFKFTLDDWTAQESFKGTEVCTRIDASGMFINRRITVINAQTLDTYCFNSCYNCGDGRKITINLGFPAGVTPSPDGVFLAGGAAFGPSPNPYRMTDPDGDGIFSITFERGVNFGGYYTFNNGGCPITWNCKENIAGQSCAIPANFNDRLMAPVKQDTVINTCYGLCSTNAACTASSLDQEELSGWFSVAPTLTGRFANISISEAAARSARLSVMNTAGQQLLSTEFSGNSYQLDLGNMPAGLYLIRLESQGRIGTQRVVRF